MTLESMVFRRHSGWHKAVHAFLQVRACSRNLYVSLGACGLCYAVSRLQGIVHVAPFVLIAFLYVQSMHILNHLTGGQADRYNEPDRARFYDDRSVPLTLIALASGATGLIIAWLQGWLPFAILLVMSLLGLSYRLPLIPADLRLTRYRRIKDIPGSKTLLIAMAWGIVTAVLPPIALLRPYGAAEVLHSALGRGAGLRAHGLFRHPRHAGRPSRRQGDHPDPARRKAIAEAAEGRSWPCSWAGRSLSAWPGPGPPGACSWPLARS